MDKKTSKPFMYIRNAEMLYDSQGREAKADKEADEIIRTIKQINPDIEDQEDDDITNGKTEETENGDSKNPSNWADQIVAVFKGGPLNWKPKFDKKHKSTCDKMAVSTFINKATDVDDNFIKTSYLCGQTEAALNAGSEGHVRLSVGKTNTAKAEYDAKIKGNVKAYCQGLFDKRSKTDGNEREIKIADCGAKAEIEGNLKGSAEFNSFDYKGKVEAEAKFEAKGNASFVGLDVNAKGMSKGEKGHVKLLHGKAEGEANFQAKGSVGNQSVNIQAKAKGKAEFKALDGKFFLAAKKQKGGGIYIPGIHGTLGEAKAKGEADFEFEADIKGKKIDKKCKVSGEAKLRGIKYRLLSADIRREKDYGTTVKAKASAEGGKINALNLEAIGRKKGNKKEASAVVRGADINLANVSVTGVDDRSVNTLKAKTGFSADIGNITATGLGQKGVNAEVDGTIGLQLFNISIGIARDTGASASTKVSLFNINLTIGLPKFDLSMGGLGFGFNFSIPFLSRSSGGGGGGGERSSGDGETGQCDTVTDGCNTSSISQSNSQSTVGQNASVKDGNDIENTKTATIQEVNEKKSALVHNDHSDYFDDNMQSENVCGMFAHYDKSESAYGFATEKGSGVSHGGKNRSANNGDSSSHKTEDLKTVQNEVFVDSDSDPRSEHFGTLQNKSDPEINGSSEVPESTYGFANATGHAINRGSDISGACEKDGISRYESDSEANESEVCWPNQGSDNAKLDEHFEQKDLQGHVLQNSAFDENGNIIPSGEDDLLIVIDEVEEKDVYSIVKALDAEEVVPDQPFTKRMSEQCDVDIKERTAVNSRPTSKLLNNSFEDHLQKNTNIHKVISGVSTQKVWMEHLTGSVYNAMLDQKSTDPTKLNCNTSHDYVKDNECSDTIGIEPLSIESASKQFNGETYREGTGNNIHYENFTETDEPEFAGYDYCGSGKRSPTIASCGSDMRMFAGSAVERSSTCSGSNLSSAWDNIETEIGKTQNKRQQDYAGGVNGSKYQNITQMKPFEMYQSSQTSERSNGLSNEKLPQMAPENVNPNELNLGINEKADCATAAAKLVREPGFHSKMESVEKETGEGHVDTFVNLKDEDDSNKYLAGLVAKRIGKSKGIDKQRVKSEKESTLSIWQDKERLKRVLIEEYTDSPKSGRDMSEKEKKGGSKDGRDNKSTSDRQESNQPRENDDQTKVKKKTEPKKPFGANKNIHTIFSFDGAEAKPVKYLKDNVACFGDE